MRRLYLLQASIPFDGGELPSEFPLFRRGDNPSTKGSVLFDEQAALRVMGKAETYANDFAIDLEHRMVSPRLIDPNDSDTDAMGWHRLEVRDGDLWAVRASWTTEGERRLRSRLQRYISPAFYVEADPETGAERVVEYINCALCSRPATHEMPPLVASAEADALSIDVRTQSRYGAICMSKDRQAMAAALASLDAGDSVAAQSALRAAMAEPDEEAPKSEEGEPPAEPEDEEYTRARDGVIALAGEGVADLASALRVLSKRAQALTGAADVAGAAAFVSEVLRERSEREAAEIRSLVTNLVELGAETPATAFSAGTPVPRLLSEGLPALRARVTALRAARPALGDVRPPAVAETEGLSEVERARAEKIKDPEQRARFIAVRRARAEQRARTSL